MPRIHISIPDSMKAWVEQQASSGRYANASDYVRHLIQRDKERAARIANIQALVSLGIESGVGRRPMDVLKKEARSQARAPRKPSR
jgi:antitoxin ParD1/3/4